MTFDNLEFQLLIIIATLAIYQVSFRVQQKLKFIWLNPMLLTIAVIVPIMLWQNISFEQYFTAAAPLNWLLEPAVVALGFPLYQHLKTIRMQAPLIIALLTLGVVLVIVISFITTILFIALPEIAVSLSLKSVTTPIAIELTEQLSGDSSITAFAIILAGIFGGLLGPAWLNRLGITSSKAQGLAVGAASHALGTATVSKISYEHGAYSSVSLILSAVLTALISPLLISYLQVLFS